MDETHVNTTAAINPRRPILLGLAQAKLELEKLRRSLPASDGVRVQCGGLQAVIEALQSLRGIDAGVRRDLTPANQRARLLALLIAAHGVVGSAIYGFVYTTREAAATSARLRSVSSCRNGLFWICREWAETCT